MDTLDIDPANLEGKLAQVLSRDKLPIRPGGLILQSSAYSIFAILTLVRFLSEFVLVGLCLYSGLSAILKGGGRIPASSSTLPSSVKKRSPVKATFLWSDTGSTPVKEQSPWILRPGLTRGCPSKEMALQSSVFLFWFTFSSYLSSATLARQHGGPFAEPLFGEEVVTLRVCCFHHFDQGKKLFSQWDKKVVASNKQFCLLT